MELGWRALRLAPEDANVRRRAAADRGSEGDHALAVELLSLNPNDGDLLAAALCALGSLKLDKAQGDAAVVAEALALFERSAALDAKPNALCGVGHALRAQVWRTLASTTNPP